MSVINYVDLTSLSTPDTQPALYLAQICIGLLNRNRKTRGPLHDNHQLETRQQEESESPHFYAKLSLAYNSHSDDWLKRTTDGVIKDISIDDLLASCYDSGITKGYIKYSYDTQKELMPTLVTLAGALDAVLWESDDEGDLSMVLDATKAWEVRGER